MYHECGEKEHLQIVTSHKIFNKTKYTDSLQN